MSFINFNNRTTPEASTYSARMIAEALYQVETKNINKIKSLVESIKEPLATAEALKMFENKLVALNALQTAAANAMPVNEGQFSWMTQDTGEQIGSERENRITVYMYDNEGNQYKEAKYDGYGEFGGMDYYELLARMNGYTEEDLEEVKGPFKELRQLGIDVAFDKLKTKDKGRKVLYPALVTDPRYNWKKHDFTQEAESDPNQSWYVEPEYDEYEDEYYESKTNEAKKVDVMYALKDIKAFNSGTSTFEETIESIVKNLGYKTTSKNIEAATEHIGASQEDEDKIPVDKDLIDELYGILESRVNEAKKEIKYYKTISKKDWDKASNDYKSVIDGEHYMMFLDDKLGSILAPVKVEEAYTEDDINTGYGFYGTINMEEDDKTTQQLFDRSVKDLMKEFKVSEEAALAVLNSKMGRKAADQIIDGQSKTAVDALKDYYGKSLKKEMDKVIAANEGLTWDSLIEKVKSVTEDWGSSDQSIMNKAIHKDAGSPKKMPSPFDSKLRAAAESAVDFYWDEWEEYQTDRDGLIDNAVRSYLRSYFKKDFELMQRMFEPVDESAITEAVVLKKGDVVKFKDGHSIYILGPKGDGYDYQDAGSRERGHHPKGWFDMMISSGKAVVESAVTEAKYDKKKLLKLIKNQDDAEILVNGKWYIIYNPDNGNDENTEMWAADDYIYALDPDGEEYQIRYKDIEQFKESVEVNEADMNDPVLVAFRAARMKREKELAKPKRKPLYGKQREKAEDDLWQISQDLKDLYADRGQMLIDMEQEAEAEGGPIADEYGDKLNKIEDEIQKLIAKRSSLEIRLAESFELLDEGRSINKIQKEWGTVTTDMKTTVEAWKTAEGKEKEDLFAKLKDLTAKKKALEKELDAAVQLKDVDAELVGESLNEADFGKPNDGDYSDEMSFGQLERCIDYSTMIRERIQAGTSLDPWMHSQIAVAENELNSVFDALDGDDGVVEAKETIKTGSVVIPYAHDKDGEFVVDRVFKNKDGETSYTGKFKESGEEREFILHRKDKIVKESVVEQLELTEGVMADLHRIAGEVKDEEEFVKQFFKEYGAKVKKNPESTEWVKSLYADTVKESVVSEAKTLDREAMMDWLDQTLSFTRTSEEFDGAKGGIWTSGENGEEWKGKVIYAYYSEDYKNRTFGVLNSWEKELNKRGWYSEWYDAGTVMIWPN